MYMGETALAIIQPGSIMGATPAPDNTKTHKFIMMLKKRKHRRIRSGQGGNSPF